MPSDRRSGAELPDGPQPLEVTDAATLRNLRAAAGALVLEFHADWCAACGLVEPALAQLAAERPITVARIDVEREAIAPAVERHGITRLPSVVLLVDGERVGIRTGIHDKSTLRSFLDSHLD